MKKELNALPYISATITSTIFGFSFLFSKRALNATDPYTLLSFRFLTAFLIMSILAALKIVKISYKGKPIKYALLLGLTQPIAYFIFESYGIKYSSSSQAGLMIALIPIAVCILGVYYLKERPSLLQVAFIFLSVSGVAAIVLMNGSSSNGGSLFGTIMLLGAVISGAAFNILSRKLSTTFNPMELTYLMMGLGAVVFNLVSIVKHAVEQTLPEYFAILSNKDFIISIGYLGVLSSIVAFYLINFTLSKIEASKSAVFANLTTIVSIAAGVVLLKEKFEYYHIIGSVMILVGVWGTNYFNGKIAGSKANVYSAE